MEKVIPQQHTGKSIDAISSREFLDRSIAAHFFNILKQRLEDVNSWQALAGDALAKFILVNSEGQDVQRPPIRGDHFKIDIPGPGSNEGDGYDWVRVEAIHVQSKNDSESFGFTVRPSSNPNKATTETAHFYSDESTSTFIVKREGMKVTAEVHDRNTKPNQDAESTADNIRHTIVGAMGAITFSKIQWQSLTDGLVAESQAS